jgi:hypothetical protein
MKCAYIQDNIITNIILADVTDPVPEGVILVDVTDRTELEIGWTWDGTDFINPNPPPPVEP